MKKNQWHAIKEVDRLWVGQYIVPNFVSNSIAIELSDSHWLVSSPGEPLLDNLPEGLNDTVSLSILLPNAYHFLGLESWLACFPEAKVYASAKAIPQLAKKGVVGVGDVSSGELVLPEDLHVLEPPGHRGGDVWLLKNLNQGGYAWITCDSFLNYERLSNQTLARLLQKVLGAAPGLKISQVIKWFLLDNRISFHQWALDTLQQYPPNLLIPAHGEVYRQSDLEQQLEALIRQRLS